jgi:cytoskeletal protein RodZ
MDKKKFDEIMDRWVAHEMESVPEIEPRPEVYRKLEEKKNEPRFGLFTWPVRLAAAGIAAALIILVIVMEPPKEAGPFVGLRKGAVAEPAEEEKGRDKMQVLGDVEKKEEERPERAGKDKEAEEADEAKEGKLEEEPKKTLREEPAVVAMTAVVDKKAEESGKEAVAQPQESAVKPRKEAEPEAGKKDVANEVKRSRIVAAAPAAPAFKKQFVEEGFLFQYQPKDSQYILSLDASSPQDEIIALSSEDNYRLIIELPQERYVYVFQVGTDTRLVRLFPNTDFHSEKNPLQAGKTIIVPMPPNWFYAEKDSWGEVLIYVVTSAGPLEDWDEIYAEYFRSAGGREKEKIAAGLLDKFEQNRQKPESQISVKVFRFHIH